MPASYRLCFAALFQFLPRVLEHRFEHSVAHLSFVVGLGKDQRLVHEPRNEVQDIYFLDVPARTYGLGRIQSPPTREDGEPTKQRSFGLAEQIVAPTQSIP